MLREKNFLFIVFNLIVLFFRLKNKKKMKNINTELCSKIFLFYKLYKSVTALKLVEQKKKSK